MRSPADIIKMIGATGGSRFYAASRLKKRDKFNNLITIAGSALIIIISVVGVVFKFDEAHSALLNLYNIALSIAILAFSAFQYAGNFAVDGELHNRCGLEINALRRHLETRGGQPSQQDIDEALEAYDQALKRYVVNHSNEDYNLYNFDHYWLYEEFSPVIGENLSQLEKSISIKRAKRKYFFAAVNSWWIRHRLTIWASVSVICLLLGGVCAWNSVSVNLVNPSPPAGPPATS